MRQFVTQRRVIDAVLEDERILRRAEPVQARCHRHRAGVAVVTDACSDLFDAGTNVSGVGESVPSEVNLIDIEAATIDQRPERLATALLLA